MLRMLSHDTEKKIIELYIPPCNAIRSALSYFDFYEVFRLLTMLAIRLKRSR